MEAIELIKGLIIMEGEERVKLRSDGDFVATLYGVLADVSLAVGKVMDEERKTERKLKATKGGEAIDS